AHSFSKTQEDEADEYAYSALVNSPYDPRGVGGSFASLLRHVTRSESAEPRGANPIRDYFRSHPPLQIREAKFRERAEAWWRRNRDQVRHMGEENLRRRAAYVE
ncbi:MAG: hypothetical protein O7F70_07970, partial [Gemmatimonadetes bacterium]|nr:hypothetical protein [Gemmatimonadota bacterium]